jgi:ATP phosphoribosyltransferase
MKGNTLRLGIPKGSLQDATIKLFARSGWRINIHHRNYFPEIDDPALSCSMCRAQEMSKYVESGILDVGLTGKDWILENGSDVVVVADLVYSKVSNRPAKWVLAVAGDSPYRRPEDLAGKIIATELRNFTHNYFHSAGIPVEVEFSWGATEAKVVEGLADAIVEVTETGRLSRPTACASLPRSCRPTPSSSPTGRLGRPLEAHEDPADEHAAAGRAQGRVRAVEIDEDFGEAWNNLGKLEEALGRDKEAEAAYRKAFSILTYVTPEFSAYNLGVLLLRQGRVKEAEEFGRKALARNWLYIPAYKLLSDAFVAQNRLDDAEDVLKSGLEADMNSTSTILALAEHKMRMGKTAEAAVLFDRIVKQFPNSSEAKAARDYLEFLQ